MLGAIPALYEQYGDLVETDLSWPNILMLGVIAAQIEPSSVTMYNIGRDEVTPYVTVHGGSVFLPDWEGIAPVVDRALMPPASSRAALASVKIELWNGTTHPQWDLLAADRLYEAGFTPVLGASPEQAYTQSYIQVFGDHAKGTGVGLIQELFDIAESSVSYVGSTNGDIKLRLVLGQDYQPCRK
jgi:hypothetical protein